MSEAETDAGAGQAGHAGAGDTSRRALICVLFPGLVKDGREQRALECLGGLREISRTYSASSKKRLGLTFSPENTHAKKTYADLHNAAGLLLKIRIRKRKTEGGVQREVLSTSVLGRVSQIYKFDSLFDFQFLPASINNTNHPPKCVFDQIIPTGLDTLEWIKGPAPAFIIPSHFTRSDRPLDYRYTDKRYSSKDAATNEEVHNRTRPDRPTHCTHLSFNLVEEMPTKPNESAVQALEARASVVPNLKKELEVVKQKFSERPIWSRNAIQFVTKISHNNLRVILPTVALYYRNGPWRLLWIRFGFDPRKDPSTRIYQTFDYRLRSFAGINSMVEGRSSQSNHKGVNLVKTVTARNVNRDSTVNSENSEVQESSVFFRPGMVPAQRQTFYQYCDIKIPEVEDIFARLPEVLPGTLCHVRRGWLPAGLDDQCREILFSYCKRVLLEGHKESDEVKFAEGSSSEDDDEYILPDMME